MARVAILDDGVPFDGRTPCMGPIGGAEGAVVSLAERLSRRRNDVAVYNRCLTPTEHNGVRWFPLDAGPIAIADHYIVNRNPILMARLPGKGRASLWLHNDAGYLKKLRHAASILRSRPRAVLLSAYHNETWPTPLPVSQRHVIPLGVDDFFRADQERKDAPAPIAVFASNPQRGLARLLDIWETSIWPQAPEATLHLFTRADFYGIGSKSAALYEPVLARAQAMRGQNVILRNMVSRRELAACLHAARVMLYWGDPAHAETYCLSIAEAQAAGVPCIARAIGALPERIVDQKTGFLVRSAQAFAECAVTTLTDDVKWRQLSGNALAAAPSSWDEVADKFENLHA